MFIREKRKSALTLLVDVADVLHAPGEKHIDAV